MSLRSAWAVFALVVALCCGATGALCGREPADAPRGKPADEAGASAIAAAFESKVRPLLSRYCTDCHGGDEPEAEISFEDLASAPLADNSWEIWRKARVQLSEHVMPPVGMDQPTADERGRMVAWMGNALDVAAAGAPVDPGRWVLRRLNRDEYLNTVRDLLYLDAFEPSDPLPADGGGGGGFSNNADTLFLTPILMEKLHAAAGEALAAARADKSAWEHLVHYRPEGGVSPQEAAQAVLRQFAFRGYRRPPSEDDVERLTGIFRRSLADGKTFDGALAQAMKAVLLAPSFLFRIEAPRPDADVYRVSDFELATRLSYFLWSSMPDDLLLAVASTGALDAPEVLREQVERMLKDDKAQALGEQFGSQWLGFSDLGPVYRPNRRVFRGYDRSLEQAMKTEPAVFLASIFREDRSILEILDADYTFVNEDLARHYGIEGVEGNRMQRVELADKRRGGVLTMAATLAITSYPRRGSPVLRGRWILNEILGTPPPPPPPNISELARQEKTKDLTLRERLAIHRRKSECATCHDRMDPLGLALENYDGVGAWRDEDQGQPVDASGVLPTGEKFVGPAGLKEVLTARAERFAEQLVRKMLAYALGRGLEDCDEPTVLAVVARLQENDYRSSELVLGIVESLPFQYRK